MFKYEDIVQQGCLFGFLEKVEGEVTKYELSLNGKKRLKKLLRIVDSNKEAFEDYAQEATRGLGHLCEIVYIERFVNGFKSDFSSEEVGEKLNKEVVRLSDRSLIDYGGIIGAMAYYLKPKAVGRVSCLGKPKN